MIATARFASERRLAAAVAALRAARIGPLRIHAPHPIVIEDDFSATSRLSPSLIALIAGLLGFVASMALQIYADTIGYPLDIGGRPLNSWFAFIPTAFENAILCAVLAGYATFALSISCGAETSGSGYRLTLPHADRAQADRARALLTQADAWEEIP